MGADNSSHHPTSLGAFSSVDGDRYGILTAEFLTLGVEILVWRTETPEDMEQMAADLELMADVLHRSVHQPQNTHFMSQKLISLSPTQ